jgi:hypothetical protein
MNNNNDDDDDDDDYHDVTNFISFDNFTNSFVCTTVFQNQYISKNKY